jgi:long-chain acyl-CoA synthetase
VNLDYLIAQFEKNTTKEAMVWRQTSYSYDWFLKETSHWVASLKQQIRAGATVDLSADFSPKAVALFLALIELNCVIVPMTATLNDKKAEFRDIAEVEYTISINAQDEVQIEEYAREVQNPILLTLKQRQHPGLILFSSGSTGKSKAAVHDLVPLLKKFETPRHSKRMITFLLFDHIGGINTLLYSLYNGGCVIVIEERLPHVVCAAIEKHKAEILPTSPTFLNLLMVSGAHRTYDLSSLELITYGTEVMPEGTLKQMNAILPKVKLQQTYGLSELGILRSKSKSSDSLFMKIGGEGFATRIVEGMLEIKAESAMLGYLNAPSPFTEDGWFKTGDAVEVEGEYIKILGRKSEMINIGGEKVYPVQIETVLQNMQGVEEVAVCGEPHPITGQIIAAVFKLSADEEPADFRRRMHAFCKDKLLHYQIPQKVRISSQSLHGDRFKKMRKIGG